MKLSVYQQEAARTHNPENTLEMNLSNFALGLAGEVGEVVEPIKKHLYHGRALDKSQLQKEIGDVLWYVAGLATVLDLSMDEIAEANISKLKARYPDGFKKETQHG